MSKKDAFSDELANFQPRLINDFGTRTLLFFFFKFGRIGPISKTLEGALVPPPD